MERQLTTAPHGHILTNANVWSPDGEWIVYDIRSDAAGSVFDGTRVERVHVPTGRVEVLYESQRGACCGVASYSPVDDRVAFILGPEDPTPDWEYGPHHRQGVIVDAANPGVALNLDARDLTPPFTGGALRGGTHVHIFSGDGAWISFTYDDHVLTTREPTGQGDLNQRNVGVAVPLGGVSVPRSHPRNHDGAFYSTLVTRTVRQPRPGSDEIAKAYEDAWVGVAGYQRANGSHQERALAFLGDAIGENGKPLTELFIVDLPPLHGIRKAGDGPLQGTPTLRPQPPLAVVQRRLTFTAERKYPGIQGVRHWPRSSPDGSQIACLMRDDNGVVQLWLVSPNGGSPRQLTRDPWDVASAFTWNRDGSAIAYVADGSVMVADAATGESRRLTPPPDAAQAPRPEAVVFSPDGRQVTFVRQVPAADESVWNQLHVADVT
ncbi:DUF3748 domain-containing protein [Lacipirellula parvula]|uniref:Uncharacterized protein YidR n=1 Tax=Lacipirellula parvula TaxID=2650471 RepID=A0A5K7X4J4_9BACT|nr:DUF3748 domain-containing protein [Lacipirellula parvula]BBO31305.1 uncharacterized protein YidR [Lacipirellula parvula]